MGSIAARIVSVFVNRPLTVYAADRPEQLMSKVSNVQNVFST